MLNDLQKANINRLPAQMCVDIMHECAERLGLVSMETEITGEKRRTVYDRMNSGKILNLEIGRHKFPCINT